MNRLPQSNDELTHLSELIKSIPVAMLTGPDEDGALVSRPMALLEMDERGVLWFFTDVRSSKVEHMKNLNLSFSDIAKGSYVSLSGHGNIETDITHIDRLWTPKAKPWFPDGPRSQHLGLLKFTPATAEYWDAPNSRMVRSVAMMASIITGEPVGLGEHGKLQATAGNGVQR